MAHLFKMEAANLNAFMTELAKAGMTAELAEELRHDQPRLKRMVEAILVKVGVIFTVLVDYVQPKFKDLESDFDWVYGRYATAEFLPIDQCKDVSREKREVTFEYMRIDSAMSTDAVLAQMDRQGLRPALYEEIVAFAKANPDEQRKYPIVALGSVAQVDGHRLVACLYEGDYGRYLDLHWFGFVDDWDDDYVFLVVRK